jgi:FkbM family methyltransferase
MIPQTMVRSGGLWCPMDDPYFVPRLRETRGLMDRDTFIAAMFHVKNRGCAIDIGAHIGTWTRQLAGQFARVLAFEPDPLNFKYLMLNTGEIGNVQAEKLALGDRNAAVSMSRAGTVNSGQSYVVDVDRANEMFAVMLPLDALELTGVGLIKLDCEGYELAALEGAKETIERERPVIVLEENICAERYGHHPAAAREFLEAIGFREMERFEYYPDNFDVILTWQERLS